MAVDLRPAPPSDPWTFSVVVSLSDDDFLRLAGKLGDRRVWFDPYLGTEVISFGSVKLTPRTCAPVLTDHMLKWGLTAGAIDDVGKAFEMARNVPRPPGAVQIDGGLEHE